MGLMVGECRRILGVKMILRIIEGISICLISASTITIQALFIKLVDIYLKQEQSQFVSKPRK